MLATLVIIIIFAGLVMLVLALKEKGGSGWVQFYAKGKDSGFSLRDIELLRRLAVKCNLENPSSLFWSQNQLDICIRSMVHSLQFSGGGGKADQDFLSKLYDYRKKIEMETPRIKNGISNSRQISEGQGLRILLQGSGVFKSQVIKSTNTHLTIARPSNSKLSGTFSWQGAKVSIYFWREDDAGYVFDSEVDGEVYARGHPSIQIVHSESLFRTQKRKSIRIKMHKPAFLYPLISEESINKIETEPGLKCFMKDLSDTGCAITIGGKAMPNMRVKVQFALNHTPISMSGTVRSVGYDEKADRSSIHLEADPLPIEIRNKILSEVFGMLPEDEEDLPFRVLEEEANEASSELLSMAAASAHLVDNDEEADTMGTLA
jgi:c-di-GMP-binding flagellar brake protein YcgR